MKTDNREWSASSGDTPVTTTAATLPVALASVSTASVPDVVPVNPVTTTLISAPVAIVGSNAEMEILTIFGMMMPMMMLMIILFGLMMLMTVHKLVC